MVCHHRTGVLHLGDRSTDFLRFPAEVDISTINKILFLGPVAAPPLGCDVVVMVRYAVLVQEDEVVMLVIRYTNSEQIQVNSF